MKNDGQKMRYLDESYENLAALGTGQKQGVFLARHRQSGRIVVKKYVSAAVIPIYERLMQCKNRHMEEIYDCAGDNIRGIVIAEFISGMNLQEYVNIRGVLSEETVLNMAKDLLEALMPVHGQGIVHRDINPDNIMISNDGILKLIDFGIARLNSARKPHDTTILGTAGYAAPEQFGFFQTDKRADIYALGVLMNKLLTGKFPNEKLYASEPVKTLIVRCIAIDSANRFQSAEEMLAALETLHNPVKIEERAETGIFSWLPGFRTGKAWKNVVATIGYLFMILATVVGIGQYALTWQSCLLEILAVFLYAWLMPLLAANIGNWDRRLFPFSLIPKPAMIVLRVVLCFFILYGGLMLETYIRTDLLQIAPK